MRIVQPIMKANDCECDLDPMTIYFDRHGLMSIECPIHGLLTHVDRVEFDSIEEWEKWKRETTAS